MLLFALPAYACIFVFARQAWVFVAVAVGALIWLEGRDLHQYPHPQGAAQREAAEEALSRS